MQLEQILVSTWDNGKPHTNIGANPSTCWSNIAVVGDLLICRKQFINFLFRTVSYLTSNNQAQIVNLCFKCPLRGQYFKSLKLVAN